MRFHNTFLRTVFFGCVMIVADLSAELVELPEQFLIPKADALIVIDGNLDEWRIEQSPYIITAESGDPINDIHNNDHTNPVRGDADLSGRVALAWDETYLYIAGAMKDDHLMGVRPDSAGNQGPPGWGCDSLMVSLASFRQPLKSNSPYAEFPFLGLRYAPVGENPRGQLVPGGERVLDKRDFYWILTPNSQWAVLETEAGYNVEAAVPWRDLEFTPRAGEPLFIAFLAADVDPGEALNQVGWAYSGNPKEHPLFRLADREDVLGVITLSLDEVPLDTGWSMRIEGDAISTDARLQGLRVLTDDGATVYEQEQILAIPQGQKGVRVFEIPAEAITETGSYTVQAVAEVAGEERILTQMPLAVIKPQPDAPLIQNPAGEITHMNPDRVAHNAFMEHRLNFYRHGWVTNKEDYVPYIRRHVEPNLKDAAKRVITTKHAYGYQEAFYCMAMYRISGDQEYLTLARDIMDYTLDSEDLGWFKLTSVSMYRYLTWLQDPNDPFAPANAEQRYRAHLHEVAANPAKELFAESGTHNRVWHRYQKLYIARQVAEEDGKPIDPRVIEYTDYHKTLIHDVGDSDDAAPGYHWVFFNAAAGIYFHRGDWQAFLDHDGFQKTMQRYVEMVSPSGACPPFASTSGWPEVGDSMWVYEWMSTLKRDGRYRWSSHRIAEYYYNHLDYRARQYHGPFDTARRNFVKAYLFADDSVAPKPPPAGSRLTWRHPLVPVSFERLQERPGTSPHEMKSDAWIPDKVVLSSGNQAQDFWGLIELLPAAGHGGELPGNIITLMIHDAALFAGQGYYENTPNFQNLLWIEDLEGLAAEPEPLKTEVPIFVDDPALTFVRIVTERYQHLPVTYTRDILFVKNGFVVVKDRVKFHTTMKARLGPCYQTRNLGPECGENWFNAYYDKLWYTGLGLGRGVQAIRNPSWDLLIYFTERPDRKHTVLDRFAENPYRNSPIQMRQVWSGMAAAGQELTFTSILLPHSPVLQPSHLLTPPEDSGDAKRIEIIRDDDNLTIVKAISELDPVNKNRFETWVMLNDTGQAAAGGPLASDARLAVVRHRPNGEIEYRVLLDGNSLQYRNADESSQARKVSSKPAELPADYRTAAE